MIGSGLPPRSDLGAYLILGRSLLLIPGFLGVIGIVGVRINFVGVSVIATGGRPGVGSVSLLKGANQYEHILIDPAQQLAPERNEAGIHAAGVDQGTPIVTDDLRQVFECPFERIEGRTELAQAVVVLVGWSVAGAGGLALPGRGNSVLM